MTRLWLILGDESGRWSGRQSTAHCRPATYVGPGVLGRAFGHSEDRSAACSLSHSRSWSPQAVWMVVG